jgi:hypothetical protein
MLTVPLPGAEGYADSDVEREDIHIHSSEGVESLMMRIMAEKPRRADPIQSTLFVFVFEPHVYCRRPGRIL